MQTKPILAALAAAALALPIAASANDPSARTSSNASTSAGASNDGGAAAMFSSLDKNGDGFISREEAAGTPHAGDFTSLDKNGDGKLSSDEHANAKEHVAGRAKSGSTGNAASSSSEKPSGSKY